MTILRSEIAQRVFNTPLLIEEGKAHAGLLAVGGRIVDGGVTFDAGTAAPIDHIAFQNGRPSMGRIGDRLGRALDKRGITPFDMVGNIAVIPIEGTLVHKGAFIGMSSGRTSYEGIQTQVMRALRSERVAGVVFEVDSFGGEAAGAFDTADMIAELSAAKPTLAILTDYALSAGYLLAAGARSIVMPPDGQAGSIGAVALHVDLSAALEKEGIKVTVLRAGAKKMQVNRFEPLPADVAERTLARLEETRRRFAAAVGRNRRRRFSARKGMETEAEIYDAAEAVAMGLVDGVGKPAEAFELFAREVNRGRTASR